MPSFYSWIVFCQFFIFYWNLLSHRQRHEDSVYEIAYNIHFVVLIVVEMYSSYDCLMP